MSTKQVSSKALANDPDLKLTVETADQRAAREKSEKEAEETAAKNLESARVEWLAQFSAALIDARDNLTPGCVWFDPTLATAAATRGRPKNDGGNAEAQPYQTVIWHTDGRVLGSVIYANPMHAGVNTPIQAAIEKALGQAHVNFYEAGAPATFYMLPKIVVAEPVRLSTNEIFTTFMRPVGNA